jgi:hypothetical protein
MGFPPIQQPLGALPEYGQPYHAWWKQGKQRNPYADGPVFSARGATPGSNSTATTGTKSSRRTNSTSSSSRKSNQGGAQQPRRFGRSQSARAPNGPATGPHAQALQKRVNATLRELEEIKAGTHAVCIAPARAPPRVVPATPRRYVKPVVTERRSVPSADARAPPVSDHQPHHALSNGDRLTRRRGNAPAVAAPAPIASGSSRRDATATAPEDSTRNGLGSTVDELLCGAGLTQYAGVLAQHGLDFQGILGSTAMQLQRTGMKMGHALRLLNTAKRLQGGGHGGSAPSSQNAWQALPGEAAAAQRPKMQGEPWSEDEEDALLKARAIYGSRWDAIAGLLPGRSKDECRRHWEQSGRNDRGDRMARNIASASTGVSSSSGAPTPTPVPPPAQRVGQRQTGPAKAGKVMDNGKKVAIQNELEAAMAMLESESEAEGDAGGAYGHNFASAGGGRATLHAESAAYQRRRADAAAVVRRVAGGGAGQVGPGVRKRPADVGAHMQPDDGDEEIDVLALAEAALSAAAQG